jgi:hypothetical protein
VLHRADSTIQCFKALPYNYPSSNVNPFDYLLAQEKLQAYVYYLQIEPEDIDVSISGNTFPIYDYTLMALSTAYSDDLYHLQKFHVLGTNSRITTTRFDVEYFAPLTGLAKTYKRIRWAGVPGIRFQSDSKLVVPLDYMSIVANLPRFISQNGVDLLISFDPFTPQIKVFSGDTDVKHVGPMSPDDAAYSDIKDNLIVGDVVYCGFIPPTGTSVDVPTDWYGVFEGLDDNEYLILRKWRATTWSYTDMPVESGIVRVSIYDGMFSGLFNINELANERLFVSENVSVQDDGVERYSYRNVSSLRS